MIVLGEWYHRVGAMAAGWLCLSAALTNTESFVYGGFYFTSSSISGLICNSNNFRSHPKYVCSQWFYVLSGLDSEKFVENHDMQRTLLRYTGPGSANWY